MASAQASAGSGLLPRSRRTTGSPGWLAVHSASMIPASSALVETAGKMLASSRNRLIVVSSVSVVLSHGLDGLNPGNAPSPRAPRLPWQHWAAALRAMPQAAPPSMLGGTLEYSPLFFAFKL